MTRGKSGRGGTVLLCLIGLMLLGCLQPGMAQDVVTKKALVLIKIKEKKDDAGNVIGCDLEVGPRGVGVCRSGTGPDNNAAGDCDNFVTWRWIGSKHGYDNILITEKEMSTAKGCFAMDVSITDTGGHGEQFRILETVDGEPPKECDPRKAPILWTYKVKAEHSEEDKNCEMDPGVVIER